MTFLLVFVITVVAVYALRTPLKRWPVVFYALAIVLDVLFVIGSFVRLPGPLNDGRCFGAGAEVPAALGAVRGGHVYRRAARRIEGEGMVAPDAGRALHRSLDTVARAHGPVLGLLRAPPAGGQRGRQRVAALMLALVLFALLLVLGVTSFNAVKRRMRADTWKRVQLLAYPFFGLVYVHLLLMLLPSALQGGAAAQASVAAYTAVFGTYAVLRVTRALLDRGWPLRWRRCAHDARARRARCRDAARSRRRAALRRGSATCSGCWRAGAAACVSALSSALPTTR